MTHVLHLDASARGDASHSRQVSGELVQAWLQAHPGDTVTHRDLGHQTLPYVTEEFIGAMYTPAEARTPEQKAVLALSDELIAELQSRRPLRDRRAHVQLQRPGRLQVLRGPDRAGERDLEPRPPTRACSRTSGPSS